MKNNKNPVVVKKELDDSKDNVSDETWEDNQKRRQSYIDRGEVCGAFCSYPEVDLRGWCPNCGYPAVEQ